MDKRVSIWTQKADLQKSSIQPKYKTQTHSLSRLGFMKLLASLLTLAQIDFLMDLNWILCKISLQLPLLASTELSTQLPIRTLSRILTPSKQQLRKNTLWYPSHSFRICRPAIRTFYPFFFLLYSMLEHSKWTQQRSS